MEVHVRFWLPCEYRAREARTRVAGRVRVRRSAREQFARARAFSERRSCSCGSERGTLFGDCGSLTRLVELR